MITLRVKTAVALGFTALIYLPPSTASAHCDTMNGPVVGAAQRALAERNLDLVLLWVRKPVEAEIKQAFERTLPVRELGEKAREFADHCFLKRWRVHRAGEGAPFTWVKPAGTPLEPAIQAADEALENGWRNSSSR